MRPGSRWLPALVALLLAAASASAKETVSGTFKIYLMGKAIGGEKFQVQFGEGDAYKAEADIATKEGDRQADLATLVETRGPDRRLVKFQKEVKVSEIPSVFLLQEGKGGYTIATGVGTTKTERKVRLNPTDILVEPGIAHLLIPLVRRYDFKLGGPQRFPVLLGTEVREVEAVLTLSGDEPARLEYGTFAARRMFLNLGDLGLFLWVDAKGRLVKVEDPMQGFIHELTQYDGRRVEAPPPKGTERAGLTYRVVTFDSGGVTLSGLLTHPAGRAEPLPALLFISDDGPHDRDGIVPFTGVNIGTAEMMDALSLRGYVVLRCDDRGVAESGGSFLSATLSVLQADAVAALDFLKSRPEVDPRRIALVGQGAGGNLALRIAAARPDIRAIVALAPSSVPLDQLALEQARRRLADQGEHSPDALKRTPIQEVLTQAEKTNKKWTILGEKPIFLDVFREYARLRPMDDLTQVRQPLWIAQGERDLQIFPHHGRAFADACKERGMKNCAVEFFPTLDHFFKESQGTIGEYIDPARRIDERFLQELARWLAANL